MERTGGTHSTHAIRAVLAAAVLAGCGGQTNLPDDGGLADRPIDSPFDPPIDGPPIDVPMPIDAMVDAAGCGNDVQLRGLYYDWDSTLTNTIGLGGARWSVMGDPTRSTDVAPNGSVSLCIAATGVSRVSVSGPVGYLGAVFIADPAVVAGIPPFIVRGLQQAMATAQYQEFLGAADGYNSGRAHVMVYNAGTTRIPLALAPETNPPQRSFVNDGGFSDLTWVEGDTEKVTLFPNRPFGTGTVTLTSTATFVGPTEIPLVNNAFTIVVIRSN